MEGVAVATEGTDGDVGFGDGLLEFGEFVAVVEEGERTVGVAGVVSGAELDGGDVESTELGEGLLERKAREQRREDGEAHAPIVSARAG